MPQSIETLLGLTDDEIKERIKIEDSKIKRRVRKESLKTKTAYEDYLNTRWEKYQTPEWKFLSYLVYWCPKEFSKCLESYEAYAGVKGSEAILEGLREEYILNLMHEPDATGLPEPNYEPQ